jgi:hypothetical protein
MKMLLGNHGVDKQEHAADHRGSSVQMRMQDPMEPRTSNTHND